MIWVLIDLVRIKMLSSGRPSDVIVLDDLNPEFRSLLNLLAKNPV
jgi:hypothetical protein